MHITLGLFVLFTVVLLRYMLSNDKGEREPAAGLWAAVLFGLLAVAPVLVLEFFLLPADLLDGAQSKTMASSTLAMSALTIGLVEEIWKYVPLALFIYKRRYFNEHTDGIIYFGFSGMAFGLFENIFYTVAFGSSVGTARLLITPFFHAATTALAGYYLARAKVDRGSMMRPFAAVAGVVILHAFYDYGLLTQEVVLVLISLLVAFMLNLSIFLMIRRARREDQSLGLSVVGINKFCRACGYPNPKQLLYCSRCGKHA